MSKVEVLSAVVWGFLIMFFLVVFFPLIDSPMVHALGGENGQPEVNIFGGIANDGVLVAVGIVDPNPLSSNFVPLEEITGTVHTNDLWFALYVPSSVDKEELEFKVDYWRERTVKSVRKLPDGSTETITGTIKYDERTEVLTVPVRNKLYLDTKAIKNHKNLTFVRITYQNFEWEFTHQSSKAAQSVGWVHNLGDVWFLYLKASFITMIIALLSFGVGRWTFDKVRYVPSLDFRETSIALFFLVMFFGASYGQLEYHAMNYRWYVMQIPVAGIITFLSLQYFKSDKRRVLGFRIPPQRDGPDIEVAISAPLIVRDRKSDTVNEDILVHRWSWKNVIYRLITGGPVVVYELHQKFHTRDISGIFDDVYMLHPDNPPCFEYPHLELKWFKIGFLSLPYPHLEKGIAVMYLAPRYEIDKIKVMADMSVIDDNNDAREKAESEVQELKVRVQSKATEKAAAFLGVVTKELFGEEKGESKEEPKEEKTVKEVEEVVDELKKKEQEER